MLKHMIIEMDVDTVISKFHYKVKLAIIYMKGVCIRLYGESPWTFSNFPTTSFSGAPRIIAPRELDLDFLEYRISPL